MCIGRTAALLVVLLHSLVSCDLFGQALRAD
jgi:hypothetical protein